MAYLIDTNVWLEELLDQEKGEQVKQFFKGISGREVHVSDFSFHSIGVITEQLNASELFVQFTEDVFREGNASLVHLNPPDMESVVHSQEKYGLDFDDAYQLQVTLIYELTLVSFDQDFDKTDIDRREPSSL